MNLTMLTLSTFNADAWRAHSVGLFSWPSYTHLKGVRLNDQERFPVSTRSIRGTGRLDQLWSYGDSVQINHGVVHRDVDGSVYPQGMAFNNGHPMMTDANGGLYIVTSGTYEWVGDWSPYQRSSRPHYIVGAEITSKGAVFAYLSGSVYEYNFKDKSINTKLSVNWTRFNFNGRYWYRSGGYRYEFRYPQNDIDAALEMARMYVNLAILSYWPDGSTTGNRFSPQYISYPCNRYSPDDSQLAAAARKLVLCMPRYSIPADLEKQLYAECVEGQNCFTSNGIAYAQDIGKVGDSIRSLLALVENPTSPKAWASTWLSMRFSDRLTYQDSKELLGAIRGQLGRLMVNMSYKETHGATSFAFSPQYSHLIQSYSIQSRARLRCDNESYSSLMSAVKKLMEWDVWPSLENTWDMIPLSFVVDWFTNISTILNNVDRLVYEQYLRVRFYERSDKILMEFKPEVVAEAFGTSSDFLIGNVVGKYYYRRQAERPQLGILDGWSPSLPAPKNYVDSAALLVQML